MINILLILIHDNLVSRRVSTQMWSEIVIHLIKFGRILFVKQDCRELIWDYNWDKRIQKIKQFLITFKIFVCGEAFCGVTQAETERVRIQILICVLFIFMNMRSLTFYSNKSYFSPLYSSQTSKQCVSDKFEMLILVGRAKKVWKKEEKTLFLDRSVQFAKSIWHQKLVVFFNRFFLKRNPLKEQRFQKCFWVFFIVLSRAVTRETLFFKKYFCFLLEYIHFRTTFSRFFTLFHIFKTFSSVFLFSPRVAWV